LELKGEAVPIAHDAEYDARIGLAQFSAASHAIWGFVSAIGFANRLFGAAIFSASHTGLLAYSLLEPDQYRLQWVDRRGSHLADIGTPATFITFDLSSDRRQLVVSRPKANRSNLWVYDLMRGVASQITFGPAFESNPRWGPDGHRIMASAAPEYGTRRIVEIRSDGRQSVILDQDDATLDDWSHDGRFVLATSRTGELLALPLIGDRRPIVVRRWQGRSRIDQSRFSPDGRLIAYNSNESGPFEVYITPFPPTGERWQVSSQGGVQPMWRHDGRELYYLDHGGMLVAVEIDPTARRAGASRSLFRPDVGLLSPEVEQYATVDGNRFLILTPVEQTRRPIDIIVNWPTLLKK
jgi:Tol biopolymer transport system component